MQMQTDCFKGIGKKCLVYALGNMLKVLEDFPGDT
jgi:hypothetical protein